MMNHLKHSRELKDIEAGRDLCSADAEVPLDYVVLFTVESWREFNRHGGNLMGFTEKKLRTAQRLRKGDRLLCYLTKVSVFVAMLEVTGSAFVDRKKKIWSDGLFPIRLPVNVAIELPLSNAIPVRSLAGKLSFMPEGCGGTGWTIYVRSSPRKWSTSDAAAVIAALKKKHQNNLPADIESVPLGSNAMKVEKRLKLPEKFRVGRVVAKTNSMSAEEADKALGSYETALSFNKVTGFSINVPIAMTCRPTAMCMQTCYFASGASSWSNALRHQRKVMRSIIKDPLEFAERVALEYDKRELSFLRWNGGGDLFAESVQAINHLAKIRPDITLWIVTRIPKWAALVGQYKNVFVHFSLDRHSLKRREEFLASNPASNNYFFSYQCDKDEVPAEENLSNISVLFFDNYKPTTNLDRFDTQVVCPLNTAAEINNVCEKCRRCFDGSAVSREQTVASK